MGIAFWGGGAGLSNTGSLVISSTPISGGTDKRVLFDDAGTIGESSLFTFNKATGALSVTGTITSSSTIQSTGGNVTGNGIIINRSGTNFAAILDNGAGVLRFYNGTATSFTGIQLGGTNAKFPAIYTVNPDTTSSGIQLHTADASTGVFLQGFEQTAPAVAPANGYRIFAQDNGAGKTQLMVIFASGAAQQIAIEP